MKKSITLIAMLFSFVIPIQSHAVDQKSLVIIDSYFSSRVKAANVSCIVLQTKDLCTDVVKVYPTSLKENINHGDAMVEVAKRQNPNLKIITLRSAATPTDGVNAGNFIDALNWVNNNSTKISSVSFSRYFTGNTTCSPSSINTAPYGGVPAANLKIINLVATLKTKNIPVFVSTGNTLGKPVDYPACLLDVNSVSVGGINKLGNIVSLNQFDINTDYFASADVYSYKSTVFGLIPNTTSAGTVAVAALYASGVTLKRVVSVIP